MYDRLPLNCKFAIQFPRNLILIIDSICLIGLAGEWLIFFKKSQRALPGIEHTDFDEL